jgi:heat shock protein HspQ
MCPVYTNQSERPQHAETQAMSNIRDTPHYHHLNDTNHNYKTIQDVPTTLNVAS